MENKEEEITTEEIQEKLDGLDEEDWKEVKPENDFPTPWNGKEMEEGDTLIGQYVDKKEEVGPNKSNLYVVNDGGEEKSVWGSVVIDSRFDAIGKGSYVKIVYKGEKESKRGGTYKDYEVYQSNS